MEQQGYNNTQQKTQKFPAAWKAESGRHLNSGIQGQPGQHSESPPQKKGCFFNRKKKKKAEHSGTHL
jgi:hypothetical protein